MRGIFKAILITINKNIHYSIASLGGVNPAITHSWILQIRLTLASRVTAPPPHHVCSTSPRSTLSTDKAHLHLQAPTTTSLTPAQIPSASPAPAGISPSPPSPVTEGSQAIISPSCPCQEKSSPFPCCSGALLCQNHKLKEMNLPFLVTHPEAGFADRQLKNQHL